MEGSGGHESLSGCDGEDRDVKIDQNFFVQEEVSHSIILGQPFITASRMETKVLDSGATFAQIWSQNGGKSVQFLMVLTNLEGIRGSSCPK